MTPEVCRARADAEPILMVPPENVIPFAKVLVAVDDDTFKVETERPPWKVEVPFDEVATKY